MKTFDFDSAVIPATLQPVATANLVEILSSSGSSAFRFHLNDIIEITETVFSRTRKGSDGKDRVIPYLGCFRNGKPTAIPFSAFRDMPAFTTENERATFLASRPVAKSLSECSSDNERYEYLKSHSTLKVSEIVPGRARDWSASPVGTASDQVKYTTRDFAVLSE